MDPTSERNDQMAAYSEAVKSGMYAKKTGLIGKYDNVRRYWEDELTRRYLRPHLLKLIKGARSRVRRLRIMDLGCGGADGFELLAGIRQEGADFKFWEIRALTDEVLDLYRGVDLNPELLEQAEAYRAQVVNEAEGEAARFISVYDEYAKAADVTRKRLYLETMERVLSGVDKIIIDEGAQGGQGVVPYLPLNELRRSAPSTTTSGGSN